MKWPLPRRPRIILSVMVAAMIGNVSGCTNRNSPPLLKVQGTVKHRGKPLDHGQVIFLPETGLSGIPGRGEIQADGNYSLQFEEEEGAPAGKYRVLVHCRQLPPPSEKRKPVLLPSLIPEKYADERSTPLRIEVTSSVTEYPLELE